MADAHPWKITAGPPKMELMLALFDHPYVERTIAFSVVAFDSGFVQPAEDIGVIIDSVEREDGSYESWNFTGRRVHKPGTTVAAQKVSGHYSTKTRKGTLRLL